MEKAIAQAVATTIQNLYGAAPGLAGMGLGGGVGAALTYANPFGRSKQPQTPRTKTSAKMRKGGGPPSGYNPGSMGGRVYPKGKKRKGKKRASNRMSKGTRKVIAKIAKRAVNRRTDKVGEWFRNAIGQLTSSVNKVSWTTLSGAANNNWLSTLQNEVMLTAADGTTTQVTQEPGDLSGIGAQKEYKIHRRLKYTFKNNSNSPAELMLFKFRAIDDTNNDPASDLDNRISAGYFTITQTSTSVPSAALAKEDNFQQYWSTHIMRECQWKMVSREKILLAGGDELVRYMTQNVPIKLRNASAVSHQKGQEYIVARLVGRPTHDTTTLTNLGVADTRVDYLEEYKTTVYAVRSEEVMANYRTLANVNFSAITGVVAGDATVTDVNMG